MGKERKNKRSGDRGKEDEKSVILCLVIAVGVYVRYCKDISMVIQWKNIRTEINL